jgi:hypothetical protein
MFRSFGLPATLQAWSPDLSITGAALSGFTTPTYVQVQDTAPVQNAKQTTVTSLTGTLSATANSASRPFTSTFYRPVSLIAPPTPNPVTGAYGQIRNNEYKHIVRKGGLIALNAPCTAIYQSFWKIPAGMETYTPDDVKALVDYVIGLLVEEKNDLYETLATGVLP